ncbi:lytic transglycosylase domain-containing protein [Pasteurella atlantica]|uniref:lytic transglycosylase domain-containing protein n=1 Tax=Phocoenobacter atlanticus TaxID=3416742 RepID=UPI00275881F7|nr:lytic transglycosylase domain-containing protein [Pasteurella atlantica]MDP8042539.1 lytic transglycosylase domain-containing protein [Pasteurella atlantica]
MGISEILLSCSTLVNTQTLNALVSTESAYNPYAIAIVHDNPLKRQPKTLKEAEIIIDELESKNKNYSVGLGQVNKVNFKKYGVTGKDLLEPCLNIKVSEKILSSCYINSPNKSVAEALSCYYAGNYSYGFVKEGKQNTAYIERIINKFNLNKDKKILVPSIEKEIPTALKKVRKKLVKKQVKLKRHFAKAGRLIKNLPKQQKDDKSFVNKKFIFK